MRLRFRTGGESHGKGLLALLEGLPKDLSVDLGFVDRQLARRQRGYGRSGRQQLEQDRVEPLCGLRDGRTIEAPLGLWIGNRDDSLERREQLASPRPGHADLSGAMRHGDRDLRANLERASARETAARVAAGAVAQLLLRELGCEVLGHVVAIGGIATGRAPGQGLDDGPALVRARAVVEASELGLVEEGAAEAMRARIDEARKAGDSLGGRVEVVAVGVPPGLGSFAQWDQRLDGRLARALVSIQAIKAFELGLGAEVADRPGSEVHDPILPGAAGMPRRGSNHAGGLEGGVSNGEPLVLRAAMKPISTLRRGLPSVDLATGRAVEAAYERSDVCAVPAASVVAEAMTALVLADAALELLGGATLSALRAALEAHRARVRAAMGGERA